MDNKELETRQQDVQEEQSTFKCPQCQFAAVCGDCYHNSGGWCRKHGGWVDADKWACSDFE